MWEHLTFDIYIYIHPTSQPEKLFCSKCFIFSIVSNDWAWFCVWFEAFQIDVEGKGEDCLFGNSISVQLERR